MGAAPVTVLTCPAQHVLPLPAVVQIQQQLHDMDLQRRHDESRRRLQQAAQPPAAPAQQQAQQQAKPPVKAAAKVAAVEEEAEEIDLISSSEEEEEEAPEVRCSAAMLTMPVQGGRQAHSSGWLLCAYTHCEPTATNIRTVLPPGCRCLCPWRRRPARQRRSRRRRKRRRSPRSATSWSTWCCRSGKAGSGRASCWPILMCMYLMQLLRSSHQAGTHMCIYSQQSAGDACLCSQSDLHLSAGLVVCRAVGAPVIPAEWREEYAAALAPGVQPACGACSPMVLTAGAGAHAGPAGGLGLQMLPLRQHATLHTYLSHPPAATLQGRLGRSWWITSAPTSRSTARTWAAWPTCRCEGTLHTSHTPGKPGCARSVQSLCGEHSSAPLFGPKVPRALSAPGSLSA